MYCSVCCFVLRVGKLKRLSHRNYGKDTQENLTFLFSSNVEKNGPMRIDTSKDDALINDIVVETLRRRDEKRGRLSNRANIGP